MPLVIAIIFFAAAAYGRKTGRVYGRGFKFYTREEQPEIFKARVAGFTIGGLILLGFAFFS